MGSRQYLEHLDKNSGDLHRPTDQRWVRKGRKLMMASAAMMALNGAASIALTPTAAHADPFGSPYNGDSHPDSDSNSDPDSDPYSDPDSDPDPVFDDNQDIVGVTLQPLPPSILSVAYDGTVQPGSFSYSSTLSEVSSDSDSDSDQDSYHNVWSSADTCDWNFWFEPDPDALYQDDFSDWNVGPTCEESTNQIDEVGPSSNSGSSRGSGLSVYSGGAADNSSESESDDSPPIDPQCVRGGFWGHPWIDPCYRDAADFVDLLDESSALSLDPVETPDVDVGVPEQDSSAQVVDNSQRCVDEGDGNSWGVDPETNNGCWIDNEVDLMLCDDVGNGQLECPDASLVALTVPPELELAPTDSYQAGEQQPSYTDPDPLAPTDSSTSENSSSPTCVDEGSDDRLNWGVNPETGAGCWVNGHATMIDCVEVDDGRGLFECPDGEQYDMSIA